jgi:hypothetical protein
MITSAADERIREVSTTDEELIVAFIDGRTLSVPLVWYPRLFHASPEQRSDWRLIGDGDGVHWPQIDEDLSGVGLLRGVFAPAVRQAPDAADAPQLEGSGAQGSRATTKESPIHVQPRGDGWAIVREGNKRALSIYATQKEAEQHGRRTARENKTEFFLHNRQGAIRERSSYGKDPHPPREAPRKEPHAPKGLVARH